MINVKIVGLVHMVQNKEQPPPRCVSNAVQALTARLLQQATFLFVHHVILESGAPMEEQVLLLFVRYALMLNFPHPWELQRRNP